jgi:hypothetical protein
VGTSKLYVNNIIKESARANSVIKIDELQSNELSENSYEIVCKLIDDDKGSETELDLGNDSSHHHTPVKFNREAMRNVNPAMNQASRKTYAYEVRKSQNDALKMNPYAKKSIAQQRPQFANQTQASFFSPPVVQLGPPKQRLSPGKTRKSALFESQKQSKSMLPEIKNKKKESQPYREKFVSRRQLI